MDEHPTCPLAIDTPHGRMWHVVGSLLDEAPRYTLTAGGGPNDAPVGEPMTLEGALEKSISDATDAPSPRRPIMRYHGGKWKLASWIISHFPQHRIYVEPFGGAASVLLQKPRCYAEIYNDLNEDVVNLMRCLRDPDLRQRLVEAVHWTPYSRQEFEQAFDARQSPSDDPVERARQMVLFSCAGYSSASQSSWKTGFRGNVTCTGTHPASNWSGMPQVLLDAGERLRGIVIEHRAALDVMRKYDTPETLHYLDPPYLPETRNPRHAGRAYTYEMSPDDHSAMLLAAREMCGHVVISGYRSRMYDEMLHDWHCVDRSTHADSASDRVECLWMTPKSVVQARMW